MAAYYNEIDPFAAAWLRALIADGLIAPGEVDTRSIKDVKPDDLQGFTQCHFFAGIGGWSYALRLAGWSDDRPVWTGSCPCQPFSAAGKRGGFDDPRHLWPTWRELIKERRPAIIFGEQSAAAAEWLCLVRGDMETMDYALAAIPLEAASAGADHLRDRYWFVAHGEGHDGRPEQQAQGARRGRVGFAGGSDLDIPDSHQPVFQGQQAAWELSQSQRDQGHRDRAVLDPASLGWGEGWTEHEIQRRGITASVASVGDCHIVECPDGKWRRLPPPRVRWLGVGIPARIPILRGFGNAIDPRPGAQFIQAADEAMTSLQPLF